MGIVDRLAEAATKTAERLIDEGNAFEDAGRHREALQRYDAALALSPALARAHLNRGNVLLATGDVKGALASYQRVVTIDPRSAPGHYSLGNALAREGRLEAALEEYRAAIAVRPRFGQVIAAAAGVLSELNRTDEAVAAYRRALAVDPELPGVDFRLGIALLGQGQFHDALASFRKAVERDPGDVHAMTNAGAIEARLGNRDEAIACYEKAIAAQPDFAEAHLNLANALRDVGRPLDAIERYRHTLTLSPRFLHAHVGLGDVLKDAGRLDEAAASFRRALEIDPQFQEAHTSLLFCLDHDESIEASRLFEEHRRFGEVFGAPHGASVVAHANTRDPERRLRVGVVSGDLNAHPVGYFFAPLVAPLAARSGLTLHAYSTNPGEDAFTAKMRPSFASYEMVAYLDNDALAKKIRDDGIDVLIDLSGHTGGNRLQVFARKPAPVQASWIAYPGTTGLPSVDYYFADPEYLPFDPFQSQFVEKLVHLPAALPYPWTDGMPPVSALPAIANGYVTFASMGRPSKLRPPVVAVWAAILRAAPASRLLVAGLPARGQYERIVELFQCHGIARDRLEFEVRCDMDTYLRMHDRVDICLDPFPYTGATTTAHALLMGVPTVTLSGRTPVGRLGPSLLEHAGLPEFVVRDTREYVEAALRAASNLPALAALRAGLRERCAQAPKTRPEAIAASMDAALRIMWKRWCEAKPPEAFSVS